MDTLIELKRKTLGDPHAEFNSWDYSFYDNIQKKQSDVDEQVIKQYFPVDHVIDATLGIYQELLGLTFE
jgi:Zn-dependent oligopeptidase